MLETLQAPRVNIADLALSPIVKPEPVFDPVGFLTPKDRKDLDALLFKYKTETIFKSDFKELVIDTKVLLTDDYKDYKSEGDSIWWLLIEDYHEQLSRNGFLKIHIERYRFRGGLENLLVGRMLFPKRASELTLGEKAWDIACSQMGNLVQSPQDFVAANQLFIRSALLFPERVDEFREQIRPKHEDYWNSVRESMGDTQTPLEEANQALVQLNLVLKLLYPDRTDKLRTDLISWDKVASALRGDTHLATVVKRLGEARLLLADEITFTDYGVLTKTNTPTPTFNTKDLALPERRKF